MTWTRQRQLVKSLSHRALQKKRAARRCRAGLTERLSSYLGSPEVLAWMFAAGTWWAAGSSASREKGGKRRSAMAAINTSLLAWQLINREFSMPSTTADKALEAQR